MEERGLRMKSLNLEEYLERVVDKIAGKEKVPRSKKDGKNLALRLDSEVWKMMQAERVRAGTPYSTQIRRALRMQFKMPMEAD